MSSRIRHYITRSEDNMVITAFVGRNGDRSIQFTIGQSFCQLSETALRDLISVIRRRLELAEGYTATGRERSESDLIFKE